MNDEFYDALCDDITAGKHGGNSESAAAYKKLSNSIPGIHRAILDLLHRASPEPMTAKEIAGAMGKPLHANSGRVTELKQLGKLRATKIVRNHSRAVELVDDWLQRTPSVLSPVPATPAGTLPPKKRPRGLSRPFTGDEIVEMNRLAGREAEKFAQLLNKSILERIA
jgi:hypothetical protein